MVASTIQSSGVAARPGPSALAGGVPEAIAQQVRAGGACLLVLGADGAIAYHDAQAGAFFDRYVIPMLRTSEIVARQLRGHIANLAPAAAPAVWTFAPGVVLCAAPLVERRHVTAVLVLAARAADFALTEDVVRACSQVGVDAQWLGLRALDVPAQDGPTLGIISNLALAMARDRQKLGSLEGELNALSTQLSNAYEELSLIDQISGGMRVNRRPSEFFRQACLDVMQVLNVRGMGVALAPSALAQEPVLYGQISLPPGYVHRLGLHLLGVLGETKSSLLVNDLAHDPPLAWLGEFASRLIAVPLVRQDQVLGCLFGLDKQAGDFDSVDAKLLSSISNESAIYLENARLFGDVHDLMMGLLHSLTSAVDAKDAYTCGHSERVALLSRHLAAKIKLPDAQVERIYMAGLLHDVGKIGVPESVLQKTGRLTGEEFEQIKKHPQIGARILDDVKQLEDIIPGVLYHHERYDGRGYPTGLAGKDIPLMGRLICLADCFDAMTSSRTYRKALPLEVALNEIRRCAGTQFDPALAEEFLRITPEEFRGLLKDHQMQAKKLLDLQSALRNG